MKFLTNVPGRGVFIFFGLVFVTLLISEIIEPRPALEVTAEGTAWADFPRRLPGAGEGGLILVLPDRGATEKLALDITLDGPASVASRAILREPTTRLMELGAGQPDCGAADAAGRYTCHLPLQKGPRETRITILATGTGGPATVHNLRIRDLKLNRLTPLHDANLVLIGWLLAAAIPLIWLTHRSVVTSQWIIVALAGVLMALLQPMFTVALSAFLVAMFAAGRVMHHTKVRTAGALWSVIVVCIACLALFKYGGAFVHRVFPDIGDFGLLLPLGVSYFLIRIIDTQMRFYRRELGDVTLREYLCFIVFPPTIPAGPIETIENFHRNRVETIGRADVAEGLARIFIGVAKKIIVVDSLFARWLYHPLYGVFWMASLDPMGAAPGVVVATLVLGFLYGYVDFSAYSDIAIGLGRLFGYRISENFNWPIMAGNIRDFWRNWHMTLSNWCMRNIYFPLTISTRNLYLPIYATMLTVGMWHVLDLNWFAWGLHHATGLVAVTFIARRTENWRIDGWLLWGRPVRVALTVLFVSAGHSFLLTSDLATGLALYWRFWRAPLDLLFGI